MAHGLFTNDTCSSTTIDDEDIRAHVNVHEYQPVTSYMRSKKWVSTRHEDGDNDDDNEACSSMRRDEEDGLIHVSLLQYEPITCPSYVNSERVSTEHDDEGSDHDHCTVEVLSQVSNLKLEKFGHQGKLYVRFDDIPVGYKFIPTEEELVKYLRNKCICDPLPNRDIQEIHASTYYGQHPKELVSNFYNEREWYFYIRHDDNESYKKTIIEVCCSGSPCFWKMEQGSPIHDPEDSVIGYRSLSRLYRNKLDNPKRTHWKMEEYHLAHHNDGDTKNKSWTLARLVRGVEYGVA